MASSPIHIATRGSALALAQAHWVQARCREAFPDQTFEIQIFKTTGDRLQSASLSSAQLPKGLFTKELEAALLSNEADLAVHSLKDLPTELPDGLLLGAVGAREDARDVLLYRETNSGAAESSAGGRGFPPHLRLADLPAGATVASSSARRAAQLLHHRPDLRVAPIRGNVGTRLHKLAAQPEMDATILAAAGLARLQIRLTPAGKLEGIDVPPGLLARALEPEEMLPCVGQAALGIEIRAGDPRMEAICARLNHLPTQQCVTAERAFLRAMGGGCQMAVAGYAEISQGELWLRACSFLNQAPQRGERRGPLEHGERLGRDMAAAFRSNST